MARGGNTRWIIGGVVIAAAVVGVSLLNLGDQLVYFYAPEEAQAKVAELKDRTIKVGGLVKKGSVKWEAEKLVLGFVMTDDRGHDLAVSHQGTPPDMFKEGQGAVAEGRLTEGGRALVARNLMVKHSEEYKKPDDHATMDKALLEKSLFKNQDAGSGKRP